MFRAHDRIVEPDGEKNNAFFAGFPFKAAFDFITDPIAFHRAFGKEQEQSVVQADGFIDALAESLSDLEVFGGEPAAHALVLKVGMKPLRQFRVFRATSKLHK